VGKSAERHANDAKEKGKGGGVAGQERRKLNKDGGSRVE